MFDTTETFSKSLIQHGPNNDRIYLMKLHPDEEVDSLIDQLEALAGSKGYSKIIAKVPESAGRYFQDHGFKLEAKVPNLFRGEEDGCFFGKFRDPQRGSLPKSERELMSEVKEVAEGSSKVSEDELPEDIEITRLGKADVPALVELYKEVFKVYPFPVFEEDYLLEAMDTHAEYYGAWHKGHLIAACSAEMDFDALNAEMTDFAALPAHRGQNLSYFLLQKMMSETAAEGIRTVYSMARANSFGMNKNFERSGFHFGGVLVNNTYIGETIESLNIWYRRL
ncbi:MAG: putative beta-lysine N-acetyltransferase [Robiginitalea sp.]